MFEALEFKRRFQSSLAAEAIANNAVVKSVHQESHGLQKHARRVSVGAASAASSSASSVTPSAAYYFGMVWSMVRYGN